MLTKPEGSRKKKKTKYEMDWLHQSNYRFESKEPSGAAEEKTL